MEKEFESTKKYNRFNRVYLCGKVVAYGITPSGAPTFVLAISKDAEDVTERDPSAYSLVDVAFGNVRKEQREIPLHSTVEVEGHVEAYDYMNEVWKKSSHVQYFVADRIEPAESRMKEAFGYKGNTYRRHYSEFYIKGEIVWLNTNTNNAWAIITIRSGRKSYVRAQFLKPTEYNGLRTSCAMGDMICATGFISTAIKSGKDGNRIKFENLNIDDIYVVSRREEPPSPKAEAESGKAPGEDMPQNAPSDTAGVNDHFPAAGGEQDKISSVLAELMRM